MASESTFDAAGIKMDEEALLVYSRRRIPSGAEDCFWLWALYRVARGAGRREHTIARAIQMNSRELMGHIDSLSALKWPQITRACRLLKIGLTEIQRTAQALRAEGRLPNISYERRRVASRGTVVVTPKVRRRYGRQPKAPYPLLRIETTSES